MILKRVFKKSGGCIAWIDLAQFRDRWQAVVKAVMILRFQKMRGISWLAEKLSTSQEGLCSTDVLVLT